MHNAHKYEKIEFRLGTSSIQIQTPWGSIWDSFPFTAPSGFYQGWGRKWKTLVNGTFQKIFATRGVRKTDCQKSMRAEMHRIQRYEIWKRRFCVRYEIIHTRVCALKYQNENILVRCIVSCIRV